MIVVLDGELVATNAKHETEIVSNPEPDDFVDTDA